ncbi:MAG: PPC domain-containing protein [Gemmataceae bacterium]
MTTPHRPRGPRAVALLALLVGLTPAAQAQRNPSGLPSPRVYQVAPAGAKAGSTVEVTLFGRHLDEPQRLAFSHPGIKAEPVPTPPAEIDPKTKQPRPRKGVAPSTADVAKFKVTVPAGVPLGVHDVRLVGRYGVSNPRAFTVGDLNEVEEREPNSDVDQAQKVELNTTVNGTIANPTDVDYYRVAARRGQRVVVSCLASSIDSRLQPQLEVYDRQDRQLASNRFYSGYDAVADFTAPEDGDYTVRVFQFTHTFRTPIPGNMPNGASDYFYRLTLSTAPWIDAVVPGVVEPGKTTNVTVYGRNLPGGKVDPAARLDDSPLEKVALAVTAPADGKGKLAYSGSAPPAMGWQDGFEVRVKNASGSSNPFLVGLARAPVVLEGTNNDTPQSAQQVPLPCEIAGRVEKRRDRDWFTFTAKRGEAWNIEAVSNRLGAPTYMTILLRGGDGKSELYESPLNDSLNLYENKFFSRSEDPPLYRFTAPADGTYQLLVASRAGDTLFGPRHTYAVRITRDEPDFQLIAVPGEDESPEAPQVGQGGREAITVLVNRSGGMAGDVELTVEGLPAGLTCPPQTLNATVRRTTLVLTAAPTAAAWAGEVRIKGTATVNGQRVVREARPGGIVWPIQPQQNTPTASRLERSLWLAVRDKAPFALTPTIDKPEVVQGDKATIKVKLDRLWPDAKGAVQVALMQPQNRQGSELPQTLRLNNNQPFNVEANKGEASVGMTVGNDVPPGVYNVVLRGQTQVPYNKDSQSKQRPNVFVVQPSAPLAVTVLPKSLAQLSLSTTSATVKAGGQGEVVVRVQRRFNFDGEFKVKLELPNGAAGLEASEVTIPRGQNEAKLVLKAQPDAKPGSRTNLVVKATALFNGKTPTAHEAKLNVNVVK